MTKEQFETWIEQQYSNLVGVARERIRDEHDAKDAVQAALARACDIRPGETEPRYARFVVERDGLGVYPVWPWMVEAIRTTAKDARVSERRAIRARRKGGALLQVERAQYGTRTQVPVHEEDRSTLVPVGQRGNGYLPSPEAMDPYADTGAWAGPPGWQGERTVAYLGPCSCGSPQFSRVEVGRDTDRPPHPNRAGNIHTLVALAPRGAMSALDRFARYVVGAVVADTAPTRTQWHRFQTIGCRTGHRSYTGVFPC